jgi:thymidylate synthase (FAD)
VKATYLWHGGSDLTVVNAARVSFAKTSTLERQEVVIDEGPGAILLDPLPPIYRMVLREKDARLLRYLAKHKHELPFAHPHISFHFKAPIFVARQLAKHQVGFVWSEISRRYVTGEPELFVPEALRKGSADIKQGSLDEAVEDQVAQLFFYHASAQRSVLEYMKLLEAGVCPEQARAVLPQTAYTEWHWTGSLLGWARVWGLRVKPDAQRETRALVEQIDAPLSEHFPVAWQVLKESFGGQES